MLRFAIIAQLVLTTACGSDDRAAHRADAIDLAGFWVEVGSDRPPMRLEIENQGTINDVVVVVSRVGDDRAVVAGEAALIARLASANDKLAVRTALTIGLENDAVRDEVDGGDNVSFDRGITSSLRVVTAALPARARVDDASSTLRWGLTLDGNDRTLEGAFFITDLESRAVVGGDGVESRVSRFDLPTVFVRE